MKMVFPVTVFGSFFSVSAHFSTSRKLLVLPTSYVNLGLRALEVVVKVVPGHVDRVVGAFSSPGFGVVRE